VPYAARKPSRADRATSLGVPGSTNAMGGS
jgi:hypothetical protein